MRRKHKQYTNGLQQEKSTVGRPRNITDSAQKRLKAAQDQIPIHIQFISEIGIWTMAEKETRTKWNTFSHCICPISFPFLWHRCRWWWWCEITYWALITCKMPGTEHLFMSHWVAWSIRTFVIYFPIYTVRFRTCNSLPIFPTHCHSKPCIVNSLPLYD